MIILAYDLSSTRIGVAGAEIQGKKIIKATTCPIKPGHLNPEDLGFKKTKKTFTTLRGKKYTSYVKNRIEIPTRKEAEERNSLYKRKDRAYLKEYISSQIGSQIELIKPDLVLAEHNEIFNSQVTSVLLGEIMGVLEGITLSRGIPIEKYHVQKVRERYDIVQLTKELVRDEPEVYYEDMTKAAIRHMLQKKYGIKMSTCDEADAFALIDYYLEKE